MRFAVTPEQLVSGASYIDAGGPGDETLPGASLAGAAAATPVESAWTSFFSQATAAAIALDTVSADLANGLRISASNYSTTETRNAESMGGSR